MVIILENDKDYYSLVPDRNFKNDGIEVQVVTRPYVFLYGKKDGKINKDPQLAVENFNDFNRGSLVILFHPESNNFILTINSDIFYCLKSVAINLGEDALFKQTFKLYKDLYETYIIPNHKKVNKTILNEKTFDKIIDVFYDSKSEFEPILPEWTKYYPEF